MPCPRSSNPCDKSRSQACAAVPGHWMFGYIHPYPDGNGPMTRFFARFPADRVRLSNLDNEEAWQTTSRPNSMKR